MLKNRMVSSLLILSVFCLLIFVASPEAKNLKKPMTIEGIVKEYDSDKRMMTITSKNGSEENIALDFKTIIRAGTQKLTSSFIREGLDVIVTYREEYGKAIPGMGVPIFLIATEVKVISPLTETIPSEISPRFVDNGDGTITDTKTNLMWQKGNSKNEVTYKEAVVYCKNLLLGGFTDWRLPKAEEKNEDVITKLSGPRRSKDPYADWFWSDDPTVLLPFNYPSSHITLTNLYDVKEGRRAFVRAVRQINVAGKENDKSWEDTARRLFEDWLTENPLMIKNGKILGIDLLLPNGFDEKNGHIEQNVWYSEGVFYEKLTDGARTYPSSFDYMFVGNKQLKIRITFSAARLNVGDIYVLEYKYDEQHDQLTLGNNKSFSVFKRYAD